MRPLCVDGTITPEPGDVKSSFTADARETGTILSQGVHASDYAGQGGLGDLGDLGDQESEM